MRMPEGLALRSPETEVSRGADGERALALSVRGLRVSFPARGGAINAVRGISFDLREGEILGIVGESGSGKSVSCKAIMNLLPREAAVEGSAVYGDGTDLIRCGPREIRRYRGREISMIFQDPMSCLNPIKTIYSHIREIYLRDGERIGLRSRAAGQLEQLHIPEAAKRLDAYPFQFSGGMAQRVQIAMALAGNPRILIADEPTTALDVTVQASILEEIRSLRDSRGLAVILVTHDLGVVADICDSVAVMYHGSIVESGPTADVLERPLHPYTRALVSSVPVIGEGSVAFEAIEGDCMPARREVGGCDFAERCRRAEADCAAGKPRLHSSGDRRYACFHPLDPESYRRAAAPAGDRPAGISGDELVSASALSCVFESRDEAAKRTALRAVDSVSFAIAAGEAFGVIGESGSGKSTLAKCMMGLLEPSSGTVLYRGRPLFGDAWDFGDYARKVQYIFQDPLGALDPLMSVLEQVMEPLAIRGLRSRAEMAGRAELMLGRCGIDPSLFARRPYGLSGGQQQRVVIARALMCEPEFLICDEPVSAMDVSVQAQILTLLQDIAAEAGMTLMFISHNMGVVKNLCGRSAVMFAGRIVEIGETGSIFRNPRHPYTRKLISSIPVIGSRKEREARGEGPRDAAMSAGHAGPGCAYEPRCPLAVRECRERRPELSAVGEGHEVACPLA